MQVRGALVLSHIEQICCCFSNYYYFYYFFNKYFGKFQILFQLGMVQSREVEWGGGGGGGGGGD